jgi:hypothetical protein
VSASTVPTEKRRRFRFGLRTGLVTIAVLALVFALLDRWLRAPYRAEQQAAAALARLGGKVLLVDTAPNWLRRYVSVELLDLRVAAIVDLSHSQVTDADLPLLQAFHHAGQFNLSDTEISDAGIEHLRPVVANRWIDLSRTRVTDTSPLFGSVLKEPSGLKLSGNRVATGLILPTRNAWHHLRDLDLSNTDFDDQMLDSLPAGLANLSTLDLSGTQVTDLRVLSLSKYKHLTKLDLRDTKVTAGAVAQLKALWQGSLPLTVTMGTKRPLPLPPPPTTSKSPTK